MEPFYFSSTYSTKECKEEKEELAGERRVWLSSARAMADASLTSSMALSSGDGAGALGSGGASASASSMALSSGDGAGLLGKGMDPEKEHMFDKVVTPTDVGKLNRLVIPKQYAEKYFPLDAAANDKGLLLSFEDAGGKQWRFRYSYWNSSQSYVMTKGWSRFVKEKHLVAGDTVSFYRGAGEDARDRLFIDWKHHHRLGHGLDFRKVNAAAPARQVLLSGSAVRLPGLTPPGPPLTAASAKRLRLFGIEVDNYGESSHDPNELWLRMQRWQTPSDEYSFHFDSPTSSPGSYTGSSLTAQGQYGSRHDLLMLQYQMGPWDKFKFCLHVIKFIVRIKERVRLRQERNQILNHGSASTDGHGKAAERWSAKRIAPRRFSKLEAWTQDQQSDMFELTKVSKRQRIASNQLCDIAPWGKLKKYLIAIKFIAIMKAGVKIYQVRKQNWNHVSASTSQFGKEAEILPAKRGFFGPEMWQGAKHLLENDLSELTEVVKIPRLLASKQFRNITPREKLKKCLNAVKFVIRIQGSYTRPLLDPWRKFKFCLDVVKFVVRMKAGVRGHQRQKHYSTHGTSATDELATPKGIGLEAFCEPEAWSRDVETDGYEVTKVARRERLLKNVQSPTFNKVEEIHSTLHEDVKAWINMKKQYGGDLHHTCVQVGSKVLGRNDIKQLITENILLANNGGNKCTVICINAGSGHGKTSLLRVLYNDQQLINAFDKRIWIQMSDKLDISMLFRKIIEFATNDHCSITNLRYLQQMVEEEITDKIFILFLDDADIEDRQFWDSVLKVLNACASGSVVVMATRTTTVATLSGLATHSYSLNPLSEENNLMLIQQYDTVGTDIQSNPDLAIVANRFISRFGGNLLKLKAIGGLLCHTDTTSLGNVKLEGSAMPLQLCHDVLPIHLKKCLALCSLFPEGYIFDRHQIILLWISLGCIRPVEGCELEDVAAEYFTELLCRSFFQHSPFHNDNDEKFVIHELIYKVVKSVSRNRYFKYEGLMDSVPENILHLSLVSSQIQRVQLMLRTEKLKDLQTFLVLQPEGQQYNISVPTLNLVGLDDFFLKFTSLETLDLSHTDIEELPGSIVSMRNLQYLSVTNTSIRALPSELCILRNLQTLKAKDCRFLTELPGDMKNLLKLRHLDVTKELGHVHLPHGIGHLTELRTLPVFHASGDSSHCCITDLGSLHNLRGCLRLSGLDSVKTSSKAQEINLRSKRHLKDLTLQWHDGGADIDDDDLNDEVENVAEQVLEGLQPHNNLQELAIRGYEGSAFPAWMQSSSSLLNLVSLTLDSCCNCTQFPAIDQLPSLKFLSIRKMYYVQQLCSDINGGTKFPSLELLNLWEMYGLEELFVASEGDCPRLRKICISRCPDLKLLPSIPSVKELVLHCGLQFPDIPELGSLASLKIESFHGVKSFSLTPPALPVLKKLEIKSCNELLSVDGLEALTTVQRLKIAGCPKLVLPRISSLAS